MTTRPGRHHRVVIIGGGFGGLFAAKELARADVPITVIDQTNPHLFQPLLYQLATGILSEGDIAPPIRDILRRQRNADVVLGEVVNIDGFKNRFFVVVNWFIAFLGRGRAQRVITAQQVFARHALEAKAPEERAS